MIKYILTSLGEEYRVLKAGDDNTKGNRMNPVDTRYVDDEVMEKLKEDALKRRAERNEVKAKILCRYDDIPKNRDRKRDKRRERYMRRLRG